MTTQTEQTVTTVGGGLTAGGAGLFGYAVDGAQNPTVVGYAGLTMAFIGFLTTAVPFISRWIETRALELWIENRQLKKRLRLKRTWIITACNTHDLDLPAWFDAPIADDGSEPKSTDSTPPIVVKRDEDTVDLPRAD